MRAPFCSESTDFCLEDRDIIGSENENENEIHSIERSLERSRINKTAAFGICLDDLMGTSPQVAPQIPYILSRLCSYIENHGMYQKSLFLEGEEKTLVDNLKEEFTERGDAPLESTGHVASIAKLLIIFFEELPEPLIPHSAQSNFIEDMSKLTLNPPDCLLSLKTSLNKLPDCAYQVLKYLSRFLLRVSFHKEYNGMNSDNLALIFGPLIFRPSSNEQEMIPTFQNIMNFFVKDYHELFENRDKLSFQSGVITHISKNQQLSRQPCPSSVMPVMSLSPLSVVIPAVDSSSIAENDKTNVPILLIEGQLNMLSKRSNCGSTEYKNHKDGIDTVVTRKRKERRFSGEDVLQRSSSEERPSPNAFIAIGTIDILRRCSSHEEVVDVEQKKDSNDLPIKDEDSKLIPSGNSHQMELVVNETNLSPHPPTAKRREIEINHEDRCWKPSSFRDKDIAIKPIIMCRKKQNPIAETSSPNIMEFDDLPKENDSRSVCGKELFHNKVSSIPRSASFPVPKSDTSSESESNSLSLSWSMLFEDSEPVRSEHNLNLSKEPDETLLSPTVQSLRNSNYYEAPLSPSAYRSYLSYRSTHLDPSVPPSPPVEQEDFAKKLDESSSTSDSIKQLTKKIHNIKKKIRKYDEKFETEFGYKPSHAEKSTNHEAKKLMSDLYKARKELKVLKEEAHLEHAGSTSWHVAQYSHILGDSTNQFPHEINKDKLQSSVEDAIGLTMKTLADDRKTANRPEAFDDMTNEQVKDEKLAIQKALLNLEKVHGKPITREQRKTCRPLYDRYRSVKRLLVRSGSFPGTTTKSKDMCSELQPILEHETMDFPTRLSKSVPEKESLQKEMEKEELKVEDVNFETMGIKEELKNTTILATKYDNSNLHELPVSEMIFQMQKIRSEKRHLRKILKDFEVEFLKLNGRKVQKEDREPIDSLYNEYKHVKARVRLLEALISKHDQHQLM